MPLFKKKRISVDITFGSIFWVLFSLLAIKFFAQIGDVLYLIFLSILITLAACPLVDLLEKKRINRRLSTLAILFSFFGLIIGSGITLAKPLTIQTELFLQKIPSILDSLGLSSLDLSQFQSQFSFLPGQIFKIAIGTFEGVLTTLAVTVMSFYMIQEMNNIPDYLEYWFGKEKGSRYMLIIQKLEIQIGNWIRGELILMLIVGVLSYLGYTIIGLPYTLALGVIAGILELIPNIGPTIAAIPAILVGLSISPTHAVAALVVSVLVQQIENQFLVPVIMKKAAGLSPVVTIIVLFIGLKLGGPMAGVLALPAILSLRVILAHIKLNKDTNMPEFN